MTQRELGNLKPLPEREELEAKLKKWQDILTHPQHRSSTGTVVGVGPVDQRTSPDQMGQK